MDLKETYNRIAEDWANDHHDDSWWHEGAEHFLSLLPKGASILDLGCGAGVKSRYMADKGFNVTGTDFSEKMIGLAKQKSPKINFEVLDIYDIGSYTKTFDAIFAQAVLLHIPKKRIEEVLKNLSDKLHPGGLLYITVKAVRDDGIEEKINVDNDYGYEYKRFFSYFSLDELRKHLTDVGMKVVWDKTNTPAGRAIWLQIIGKK